MGSNLFVIAAAIIELTLPDCIMMARRQSVEAEVCMGELKAAYWQYRSHRADLLPEVWLDATAPSYVRKYSPYQKSDGSYSYVQTNNLSMDGMLSIRQKIGTGGEVRLKSSLDYIKQLSSSKNDKDEQFMSIPIAVAFSQPIFGVNTLKWEKKIEPEAFKEAKAKYLSNTESVALMATNKFFSLLIANENVNIAKQNMANTQKLYEIAIAKREIGQISENDLLQMKLSKLQAQSTLTEMESQQKTVMYDLKTFLNIEEDIEPVAPERIPEVVLYSDDVLQKALENNAFATTMRKAQLMADYNVAVQKGNRRTVNLNAQVGLTSTDNNMRGAYNDLKRNETIQLGVSIPIVDWGKRRGKVKMAETNREIINNQIRQETQQFRQKIFILTEQFNNQRQQLMIAEESDKIAEKRYNTNVDTYQRGSISTLELSDAQTSKDKTRRDHLNELYNYWNYYYQIRSITLWDFESNTGINADFDRIFE